MHKKIADIVPIFVKHGLSPRLQTAGLATREQLAACAVAGARHINISLDSLVEAKQDYINGDKPGSWRRALRAIADANAVFTARNRLCALGCVLSRMNYREIPAIVEFATRIGWWVSLVPVHITSLDAPLNFRGTDARFSFTPDDHAELDRTLDRLLAMKRHANLFDSAEFLRSAFRYLKTGEVTWRRFNAGVCDSPNLYFAILPNGEFSICCDHRYQKRLNLADPEFPAIYRSREFRAAVFETTSACRGCNYGSYPEMTLLARDRKALLERAAFFAGFRNRPAPRLSFEEILAIAEEVRVKHRIEPFEAPHGDARPAAASQRYGDAKVLTRGDAMREWTARRELLRLRAYDASSSSQ
jgi:MoaA/NifB/PqqE/SkfB family radical SAM enzyme